MDRLKRLNGFQKGVLLVIAIMVLAFTVLYPVTLSKKGFAYGDALMTPAPDGSGGTVYSGKLWGKAANFTVTADKKVTFRWGEQSYGPYVAYPDPSACPDGTCPASPLGGMELRCGTEVVFRGIALRTGGSTALISEDGMPEESISFFTIPESGVVQDGNGTVIDVAKPSPTVIIQLMDGPELTRKGNWAGWLSGVILCLAAAVSVLFADELFRWQLSFRIRDAETAEPSDLELAGRYIAWTALPLLALTLFLVGLR